MLVSCIEKNCPNQNYFSILPLEIITNVFSFLSNVRDCGECMRVCHQWRDNMISLSADQPRALRLGNNQLDLIRDPLLYLGYLVHNVEVRASNVRLFNVIESLAQLKLPFLRSLSVVIVLGEVSHTLATPSLNFLGETLTRLEIKGNTFSEALVTVLMACPHLTHLCYRDNWRYSRAKTPLDASVTFPNLRLLALESPNRDCPLIVSRSPNLRYLKHRNSTTLSLYVAPILQACPTLKCMRYFDQGTPLLSMQDPLWWQDESTQSNQVSGLHTLQLAITQTPMLHDFWKVLDQHYMTLRSLHLHFLKDWATFDSRDWFLTTMAALRIPEQLEQFTYEYTRGGNTLAQCQFAELFILPILKRCHQLTHVTLSFVNQRITPDIWSALADLEHLTHLYIMNQYDSNQEMVTLLTKISTRCIPLQEVEYKGKWFNHSTMTASLPTLFSILTTIPTLRHITINAEYEGDIDKIIMSRFLKRLKQLPNLESISFECLWGFTTEQVFRSLRNLPKLKSVSFSRCNFIIGSGMVLLIDRQPRLNELIVNHCIVIQQPLDHSWEKYARSMIPRVVSSGNSIRS